MKKRGKKKRGKRKKGRDSKKKTRFSPKKPLLNLLKKSPLSLSLPPISLFSSNQNQKLGLGFEFSRK